MPLQHISDNVLKSMRRGINKNKTEDLIKLIRDSLDKVAIRTTFVVGSPQESDSDFEELANWVSKVKFDRLGVFTYSHEEDTHFYNLKDNVSQELKNKRKDLLMNIQREISRDLNTSKLGNVYKVLFDYVENGYFIGRTEFDSPDVDNEVRVKVDNNYVRLGDFTDVEIIKTDYYDLYGKLL